MLLLRRHEIHRLESVRDGLWTEREQLQHDLKSSQAELLQARQQIEIQTSHADALQSKIGLLEQQLHDEQDELRQQVHGLSRELADARMYEQTRAHSEDDGIAYATNAMGLRDSYGSETALLLERIDAQELEIEKWKGEATGRGNEAVSRSWQASVDEAVRREREKDAFVIIALREEIERLKAG